MKKLLDVQDIEKIKIIPVYWGETDMIKDIQIKFPEEYEHSLISLLDVGLVNTVPKVEYTADSTKHVPKVKIELYGILEEGIKEDET